MSYFRKDIRFVLGTLLCLGMICFPLPILADSGIQLSVEVIKADQKTTVVDPQLEELARELKSVLNYTGFTLVKETKLRLKPEIRSEVLLSSKRRLDITFQGFEGKQARVIVAIIENEKEIFSTTLLLVNKGTVLIGGPSHEGGVLLLRIEGRF